MRVRHGRQLKELFLLASPFRVALVANHLAALIAHQLLRFDKLEMARRYVADPHSVIRRDAKIDTAGFLAEHLALVRETLPISRHLVNKTAVASGRIKRGHLIV